MAETNNVRLEIHTVTNRQRHLSTVLREFLYTSKYSCFTFLSLEQHGTVTQTITHVYKVLCCTVSELYSVHFYSTKKQTSE